MIRNSGHYVSKTACILRMLEMIILLTSASLLSAFWLSDGPCQSRQPVTHCIFALVILFSMSTLGMYQHSSREGMHAALVPVMREHGGRVTVPSTPGKGASFRLLLPIRPTLETYHAEKEVAGDRA